MSDPNPTPVHAVLVEREIQFTLLELSRACRAGRDELVAFVEEGVLVPLGGDAAAAWAVPPHDPHDPHDPHVWRFGGEALRRARTAQRLAHDLELNAAAVALVIDLLDEIEALRARLAR